jgi:uncharacterized protein YgiM (DUF1202 family)
MRGSFAGFVVVVSLILGASSLAAAETVVAKDGATVYLKAGESSKVVVKVKSGQEMTVVRRDGRWLKVRVKGRTGFIPRTKVSGGEGEEEGEDSPERQTRRRPYVDGRSTDRGWGGEPPEDRRGVDAVENVETREPEPKEPNVRADRRDPKEPKEPKGDKEPKRGKEPKEEGPKEEPVRAEVDDDPPTESPLRGGDGEDPMVSDEPKGKPERERVRLSSGTQLRAKPGNKSKKVATVEAGNYFLMEERNGWARIESEDGERGWVSSKLLSAEGSSSSGPSKRIIAVGAKLGMTLITQGTRTAGGAKGIPDNYNLSTQGVNANIGGTYAVPLSGGKFYAGGELAYVGTKALPGIQYMGKTTGISMHSVDLSAVGGYNLRNSLGMIVWGRLGYHYDVFNVSNVTDLAQNTAKLPSESLSGITAGLSLTVPMLTKKIGAMAAFDALVTGTRAQTKNLEDGASPSATGLWLLLGGNYRLSGRTTIDFGYRLAFVSNSFGTPPMASKRGHTGTNVTRADVSHGFAFGVSQSF